MESEKIKKVPNFGTMSKCDALISLPSLFFLDHAHTHSTTTLTHSLAHNMAQEIDTKSYHNGCHPPPPPPSPHQLKTSHNMTNIRIEAIDSVQYHHHTQNSHNMVQTWKLWAPSILFGLVWFLKLKLWVPSHLVWFSKIYNIHFLHHLKGHCTL